MAIITLYGLDVNNYFNGQTLQQDSTLAVPAGYTNVVPPSVILSGQYAVLQGQEFVITYDSKQNVGETPDVVNSGGLTTLMLSTGQSIPMSSTIIGMSSNSTNAKAFYLNNGSIASNVCGFVVPRDCSLISVHTVLGNLNSGSSNYVTFRLRPFGSNQDIATFLADSRKKFHTVDQTIVIPAGSELAVYAECQNYINRPSIQLELAWRI